LAWKWDALSDEQIERQRTNPQIIGRTLLKSTGVNRSNKRLRGAGVFADQVDSGKRDNAKQARSLKCEVGKWKDEPGENAVARLEAWVESTMEDYLYLSERRMRT
jgi:hypothetical protein